MSINYPGSLDDTSSLIDPTGTTSSQGVHANLHVSENAAIRAIETKLGTSASIPNTPGYALLSIGNGGSAWGSIPNTGGTGGASITLTTSGVSGVATYNSGTGILNVPNYTYTLPTASTTVSGGVKVDGTTITISSGVISSSGGAGTPGGSTTQLQYNNAGVFAGSADLIYSSATKLTTIGASISAAGVQALQVTGGLNVTTPTKDTNLLYTDPTNSVVMVNSSTWDSWFKFYVNGGSRFDDDFRFQKNSGDQNVARMGGTGYNLVFKPANGSLESFRMNGDGTTYIANTANQGNVSILAGSTTSSLSIGGAAASFTNTPTAPTAATTDSSTKLATTAFVKTLAGTQSMVYNEVPAGTVNGSNTAFTLASTPATSSLNLYKNGIRLKAGGADYTLSGSTITFVTAPPTGAVLLADYNVSNTTYSVGTNSIISDEVPTGLVNGSNAAYSVSRAYIGGALEVYINGVKQARTTHFTETNPALGTFTLSDAPLTGDVVTCNYQYNLNPASNADTVDGIHASTTATANQLYPLNANAALPLSIIDSTTGAWTVYTPSFTNLTVGNGTLVAKYQQIGKLVNVRVSLKLGTTSAVSGDVSVTHPVTAATYAGTNNITPIGNGQYFNGSTAFIGFISMASSTTAVVRAFGNGASYPGITTLSATVPFTWASTHEMAFTYTYEGA